MVSCIKDYILDYKRSLDYLRMQKAVSTDVEYNHVIDYLIKKVRSDFFRVYQDQILRYFYPFDRSSFGHLEDCETFLLDGNTKAIRKFNDFYYVVGVKRLTSEVLVTESPDDYPLHILPFSGEDYPEYLIADYLKDRGF